MTNRCTTTIEVQSSERGYARRVFRCSAGDERSLANPIARAMMHGEITAQQAFTAIRMLVDAHHHRKGKVK